MVAQRYFLLILFATLSLADTMIVKAQSTIELEMTAAYTFGEQITFAARTKSPLQIVNASILILDNAQGVTFSEQVSFDPEGYSEFHFDARRNGLRPFTTISWHYRLLLADGSEVASQGASIRYDDNRFAWRSLESDALRVHWYGGGDDFGVSALNAGEAGLQKISELVSPDPSNPVDIFIYANENDLRGSLSATDEVWVVGHADSVANIVMVTIEPGPEQNILMEQRIPHELMHVMLYRQVGVGYKNIPTWLREGIAALMEVYPNPEYDRFLMDAAARNSLIPIGDLCAPFSPGADSAFLAYAESRSFTNYLRSLYGSNGIVNLASIYAGGVDCERGPERAFGVSLAKLERDWQASALGQNGLAPAIGRFAPYLVLLCLIVFVPLIGVVGSRRRRDARHGT